MAAALFVGLAHVGGINKKPKAIGDGGIVSGAERAANATTVEHPNEFDVVCRRGSVSNASEYENPYKIAAFFQGDQEEAWQEVLLDNRAEFVADPTGPLAANVVACLSRDPDSEVKSGTCDFKVGYR